jgi:hypothetical protein
MPFPLLLGFVAGLLELIPFLGPILIALVAVTLGFSISPALGLSALAVGLVIQQLESNLLAPRIMDRAVGVSPVVTLLALVGFAALLGPIGGLLAIPLAATLQVFFDAWLANRALPSQNVITGRTSRDRIRYQLQELTQDLSRHVRAKDGRPHTSADQAEEELEQVILELDAILADDDQADSPGTPVASRTSRTGIRAKV